MAIGTLDALEISRVRTELGIRVSLLIGRQLDDYAKVVVVMEDVLAGWLARQDEHLSVEQWWDSYVDHVEAAVGGYDCAAADDLDRVWLSHTRSLTQKNSAHSSAPSPSPRSSLSAASDRSPAAV